MHSREVYLAKLRDPRWQKLRLQVFERDEWACQVCMEMPNTPAVTAAAIGYWLDSPELAAEVVGRYLLSVKQEPAAEAIK